MDQACFPQQTSPDNRCHSLPVPQKHGTRINKPAPEPSDFSEPRDSPLASCHISPYLPSVLHDAIKQEPLGSPTYVQQETQSGTIAGKKRRKTEMDLEDKEQDLLKIQIKNENGPSSYQNHHASFMPFESEKWQTTFCQDVKKLPTPAMTITADKGFNYSTVDEAFIAQKKNHFQLTCHITKQGMHCLLYTSPSPRDS